MEGSSRYKVPGGKLIIIKLTYSDKIESFQILGDFFLTPEEALSEIENMFITLPINITRQDIAKMVSEYVEKNNVQLVGITPEAIAEAVVMAIK